MALTGDYRPSSAAWVRDDVAAYLASDGADGVHQRQGRSVVLLTTLGARSGALRKTPLMRIEHDGEYAVIASANGADRNPAWYYNLRTHPRVRLQDKTRVGEYRAREVFGDEKAIWWRRAVAVYPPFDEYQGLTDRRIPLFVLSPVR